MNPDGDENFLPDDLQEMAERFSGIIRDADEGYVMEFIISRADSRELVSVWEAATKGDAVSAAICWNEYGKIMRELRRAIKRDDTVDDD